MIFLCIDAAPRRYKDKPLPLREGQQYEGYFVEDGKGITLRVISPNHPYKAFLADRFIPVSDIDMKHRWKEYILTEPLNTNSRTTNE